MISVTSVITFLKQTFLSYLDLTAISIIVQIFPRTLFPVGLCYCTRRTSHAVSFLSLIAFWSLISHSSPRPFYSHHSWWSAIPTRPFISYLSLLSQHSLRSLFTSLSLNSVSSLRSLGSGNARHSRYTIGSWNTRKSMGRYGFLRTKQQMHSLD